MDTLPPLFWSHLVEAQNLSHSGFKGSHIGHSDFSLSVNVTQVWNLPMWIIRSKQGLSYTYQTPKSNLNLKDHRHHHVVHVRIVDTDALSVQFAAELSSLRSESPIHLFF